MIRRPPNGMPCPPHACLHERLSAGRRRLVHAGLVALALGATGCTSLVSRPSPVKHTFLLEPPMPEAVGAPKGVVLRIGAINVAAPFRGKQFVYRRSDLGYESDYYDEWFVPPGAMLADATAKALAAARVFERVVPAGAAGNEGDFLLDGFVSAFYGDVRQGHGSAELAITFYLTSADLPGSAPVWTHAYEEHAALGGTEPDALPKALNAALAAVLGNLARDLAGVELKRP